MSKQFNTLVQPISTSPISLLEEVCLLGTVLPGINYPQGCVRQRPLQPKNSSKKATPLENPFPSNFIHYQQLFVY